MLYPEIISNFISEEDSKTFISYINENLNSFIKEGHLDVYMRRLGIDQKYSSMLLNDFNDSIKPLVIKYSNKFVNECKLFFKEEILYPSQFWLVKRFPNNPQPIHTDVDTGSNSQLKYSGVIYLNSLSDSGNLFFPNIPFRYVPNAGDLVIFPSEDHRFMHCVEPNNEDRYVVPIWATKDENFKLF